MPSDLYIVRHGQTTYNASGTKTFTGWIDVDISEVGVQQARDIAQMLKNVPFDIAYTSRLLRATHTLEILLEPQGRTVPIVVDDRIIERDYGELSGQLHKDVQAKYPDMYKVWHRSYDVPPPGGESVKIVEKRVYGFIHELLRNAGEGKNILLSAHGNSIRAMRAYLETLSVEEEMKLEVPQNDYLHYRIYPDPKDLFGGKVEKVHPA
jgi:2,3-bisphosphoglycerate-dependent phosphoglycerate mutase